MDWPTFVRHYYDRLKRDHGNSVTWKQALVGAKEPYRRMRANLFKVRKELVKDNRDIYARRARGKERQNYLDRADHIETHAYAALLQDFATEYD